MRHVTRGHETYALVLSGDDFQPGAKFVSEARWPLQVGLMLLPAGHAIAAHAHLIQNSREVRSTQEFLFVVSGKMEVDYFDEVGQRFHTETIGQGEALFHIQGGHAFRFPEPTRLIEVKSGPYPGREKDKTLLDTEGGAPHSAQGSPTDRRLRDAGILNNSSE